MFAGAGHDAEEEGRVRDLRRAGTASWLGDRSMRRRRGDGEAAAGRRREGEGGGVPRLLVLDGT